MIRRTAQFSPLFIYAWGSYSMGRNEIPSAFLQNQQFLFITSTITLSLLLRASLHSFVENYFVLLPRFKALFSWSIFFFVYLEPTCVKLYKLPWLKRLCACFWLKQLVYAYNLIWRFLSTVTGCSGISFLYLNWCPLRT